MVVTGVLHIGTYCDEGEAGLKDKIQSRVRGGGKVGVDGGKLTH